MNQFHANHDAEYMAKYNRWKAWNKANPHVWEKFQAQADALRTVADKSGAWLAVAKLRWDHYFATKGHEFKMPNDYTAFYARAYMAGQPERQGFFEIRRMFGEDWEYTKKVCGLK